MIIEHDGKRIDTEKEIRKRDTQAPARFAGQSIHTSKDTCVWVEFIPSGSLDYWCDWFGSVKGFVREFENVPQKHERWYVVSKETGYVTEEAAKVAASSYGNLVVAKAEWES